jgi:hypothetical protein
MRRVLLTALAGVTERAMEQTLLLPLVRMILDEADRFPIADE